MEIKYGFEKTMSKLTALLAPLAIVLAGCTTTEAEPEYQNNPDEFFCGTGVTPEHFKASLEPTNLKLTIEKKVYQVSASHTAELVTYLNDNDQLCQQYVKEYIPHESLHVMQSVIAEHCGAYTFDESLTPSFDINPKAYVSDEIELETKSVRWGGTVHKLTKK